MPKRVWNDDSAYAEARKFKTRNDFRLNATGAYYYLRRQGLFEDACSHMKRPSGNKWCKKSCAEIAKRYNTRKAFYENHAGCYVVAQQNGWLSEICSHMTYLKRPPRDWSLKLISELVHKKYNGCIDTFRKDDKTAYQVAYANGWIGQVLREVK